jgi:hypothetical protein
VPVEVPTICRPALVGPALRRAVMVSTGKPRSAYCGAQFAVQGCSEEYAETVFDLLDQAKKDKMPMRLKPMGIDETLNLAQLTLAYQEEGPDILNGGKKKKEPAKRAKSPRSWDWMKRFEKAPAEEAPSLME